MAVELVVVLVAVGVSLALYRFREDTALSIYRFIRDARAVISALVGVVVAVVFIGSGYLPYMILGALLIGYATIYILVEDPHERILEVVG